MSNLLHDHRVGRLSMYQRAGVRGQRGGHHRDETEAPIT